MDTQGFSLLQGTGEIAAAALLVDSQWLAAETNLGAVQLFELRLVDTLAMEQDWAADGLGVLRYKLFSVCCALL